MKTWRRIKNEIAYLVGTGHGLDKINGANLMIYLTNIKDAKFTWEEKKALLHFLKQSSEMKKEDMAQFELSQNECDVFKLSQTPISQTKYNEEWDVERFTLAIPRIKKVEEEDGFYYTTSTDNTVDIYDEDYDRNLYDHLIKNFGPHWAAVKAGLRGWYYQLKDEGVEGFDRNPTNF